jgi:predicted nuclease with TOPRIM domain
MRLVDIIKKKEKDMLEKEIEKAQGMLNLLNHTLTLFEKDFEQIKNRHKVESDAFVEEQKKKLSDLLRDHQLLLVQVTKEEIENFSKFLDGQLNEIYDDARKKAEQRDIEEIFKKYGGRIVPLFFKALIKCIFKPFRCVYPFSK